MKLKFYMRGIGIAMIITALLVGFSYRRNEKGITDAQVIARAKELGMIENNFLSPAPQVSAGNAEPEEKAQDTSGSSIQEAKVSENLTKPEETREPEETKEPEETEAAQAIKVEIVRGDSSNSVSRKLEEAGLVADAKEYNSYLCENGYDKRISVGSFEIPAGTDPEDIARIITGQNIE